MTRRWAPRSVGRIFDSAFGLYRGNLRLVVGAAMVTVFPAALIVGLTQVFLARGMLSLLPDIASTGDESLRALTELQILSLASNAATPLLWIARVVLACALLSAAGALFAGDPPRLRDLLRVGWMRLFTFALVSFALTAGTLVLLIPGIVPGVIFAIRFSLAPAVAAIEGADFEAAFRRSWGLTSGHAWRVVGFYILLVLFSIVLESAVTSPSVIRQVAASIQNPEAIFAPLSVWWKTAEGLLSALAVTLVMPFAEFAWFFFYTDLRARREGMDIVGRALEIGRAAG